MYDRFTAVMEGQPALVKRAELCRQRRILRLIRDRAAPSGEVRFLEVGVGTGTFARLVSEQGWTYLGVERNENMARAVTAGRVLVGDVPPFPAELPNESFDVGYAAFVLEHVADGLEAYRFVAGLTEKVRKGGLICLVVPDSLSLGMEFWNLDYTHRFPTTERNVSEIARECGLAVEDVVRYRGPMWTGAARRALKFLAIFYRYRLWERCFGKKAFFYGLFQYVNQEMLVLLLRKEKGA
ncbi:MAG: class I SAM-dependent methyltransferase [Verrucomicrobiota bacterium]